MSKRDQIKQLEAKLASREKELRQLRAVHDSQRLKLEAIRRLVAPTLTGPQGGVFVGTGGAGGSA